MTTRAALFRAPGEPLEVREIDIEAALIGCAALTEVGAVLSRALFTP